MANKNHPMYVEEWLEIHATELVEHMRRHHTMTDMRAWEQHISELLQLIANATRANTFDDTESAFIAPVSAVKSGSK